MAAQAATGWFMSWIADLAERELSNDHGLTLRC
jgi:hypothetical protein